ncbi:hypothetical protein K431DRAFT_219933 [Polychaeton citri CBS 116435]|uniref:Lethal giant larvae (Lgl)-like C-terminal domain-containing protein n=1 Tax=Polychaeton citri CBS 116435 TaxID=1314669 RepID=A0A9P4QA32_9PEZI|nr:hypothetical protein K431DRAFT_219933 [Polychaeton citri CBS 116435]
MAHLLRGKQAGIHNDLSAGLTSDLFVLDDLARYGVNSQIGCLAYDPVQSLLAVGTKSSQFGPGQIYVFGQGRIQVTFPLPARGASVEVLQFCAEKLVCLDSKHEISVYSLEARRLLASHSPPGIITTMVSDPMLDYVILGLQSGDLLAYDLDRESMAPFRINNLWQEIEPRARAAPVQTLQFHPRDIGALLIGYTQGAVVYSFKLNKSVRHYMYELSRGAPGGDSDPAAMSTVRRPRLTQAVWHPTGTFVMTGHEDGSLVFWDTMKDGRLITARTIGDVKVHVPGTQVGTAAGPSTGTFTVREPLFRLAWCAKADPDDNGILIAGGSPTNAPTKGLTFLELGRTPVYNTSSWDALCDHLENPKRQHILPTPPHTEVIDFCLIPKQSPHFGGAQEPIAIIALLSSGQLLTLSFPSGMPISPTNQLHLSLSMVHPFVRKVNVTSMAREKWLGMMERRQQGPLMLKGGAEAPKPLKRFENRQIVQVVHADGIIRLWDVGDNDEIENEKVLQVDVGRAIGRYSEVEVTGVSFAGGSGELAVGTKSGELVVFKWGHNRNAGREPPTKPNQVGVLTDVTSRTEPTLSEGLLPFTLLDQKEGPVTAVKLSDVGFVAAAFEAGTVVVIDLRGPAVIFSASVQDFMKGQKSGSLRRRGSSASGKPDWATSLDFSVMTAEGDDYSSILLHVGTNLGQLATLKVVPEPSGRYAVHYSGAVKLDSKVTHLFPINAESGRPATASPNAVASLRSGARTNGALLAVTPSSVHIIRPATNKGAHKSFDSFFCDSAGIARYQNQGYCFIGLFGDGYARVLSIPGLKEIASLRLSERLDVRRFGEAAVTNSGNIIGFTGPSELGLTTVFGMGDGLSQRGPDKLFNPEALIPPRPTISNMQWLSGTQYITPSDMDLLIGGPGRPPSKRMIAQAQADEAEARRKGGSQGAAGGSNEGYLAYMQRQIQERTEKLGLAGDSMEELENNSRGWLTDVDGFVKRQKRNAATGIIKAKFGF